MDHLDNRPVITINTGAMNGDEILIKRALDILLSSVLLVTLSAYFSDDCSMCENGFTWASFLCPRKARSQQEEIQTL